MTTPESSARYYQRHREKSRTATRAWIARQGPEWRRQHSRVATLLPYHLTPETYDALLAAQGGVCRICQRPAGQRALHVEHDHACCAGNFSCGRCIRGLVCATCNFALARVEFVPTNPIPMALYLGGSL